MKAYYGSRIGPNMTKTPEGFLICLNVPIARTGTQKYLGQEIDRPDLYGVLVEVVREPEEVFDPATIASFEGKTVTNDHPPQFISPDNNIAFDKGDVTNVRRGSGEESDLLLADLIIKDPNLISEIENGKRDVSAGYYCEYKELGEKRFAQWQIRGNHVAVVDKGRAGSRVAIKDSMPDERSIKMPTPKKITKGFLAALGLKHFAQDAEPEQLQEALDAMEGEKPEVKPEVKPDPKPATNDEEPMPSWAAKIIERLEALEKSDKEVHSEIKPETDSLEALQHELNESPDKEKKEEKATDEAKGEEAVTIEPEKINDNEAKPAADSRTAALAAIDAVKPVVAAIQDPATKKAVTDAMSQTIRAMLGKAPAADKGNTYGQFVNPKTATDSAGDGSEFGKKCAERNPHLKKKEVK